MSGKRTKKTTPEPEPPLFDPHPLLVGPDDEPEPSRVQCELIYVYRLHSKGEREELEAVPADELADVHVLRERYGAGLYYLVGRDFGGRIAGKATRRVGALAGPPPADADEAAPDDDASTPARRGPTTEMWLMAELIKQTRESNQQIVSAITELAGARLADQAGMIEALSKKTGGASPGMNPLDVLQVYEGGMAKVIELLDAAGEDGSPADQESLAGLIRNFTDAARAVKGNSTPEEPKQ